MKYQLKDFHRNISDSDLLHDLKTVAEKLGTSKLSSRECNDNGGKYTAGTIAARFGSWNIALEKAELNLVHQREVSKEELFKNLEHVWISIGRQPVFRDMKDPISKYSTHQYVTKFGTWRKGLEAFVDYINSDDAKGIEKEEVNVPLTILKTEETYKHKTKRFPSERLKVQVLMRDGNKCRLCGVTLIGDNIHFDHIIPWSKGGETTLENLQVLCDTHNLAKGNLEYPK
jgi:5-methylcytosine-specific restriction endonuclease McrA